MMRINCGFLAVVVAALGLTIGETGAHGQDRTNEPGKDPTLRAAWCTYGTYPRYRDAYNAACHLADSGYTTEIRYAYTHYIVYYWR